MKICFVAWTTFTPGGIPRVLTAITNELSKRHEVSILCLKKNPGNVYGLALDRIELHDYEMGFWGKIRRELLSRAMNHLPLTQCDWFLRNYATIRYPRYYRRYICNYLNTGNFDVIIGASGLDEAIMIGALKPYLNCPKLLGWLHTSFVYYFIEGKTRSTQINTQNLAGSYLKALSDIVVLSKNDVVQYRRMGIEATNIYNPATYTEIRRSPSAEKKKFIYLGALSYCKGVDYLIGGCATFLKEHADWELVVYGEGPLKVKMISDTEMYGIEEQVTFAPYSTNVDEVLSGVDAILFTSRWEGFGVVLLEAMAAGLPIVASDIPITRELLEGKGVAEYFEAGNSVSLSEAMKRVAGGSLPDASKNGREIVKEFAVEKIADKWEKVLNAVVNE